MGGSAKPKSLYILAGAGWRPIHQKLSASNKFKRLFCKCLKPASNPAGFLESLPLLKHCRFIFFVRCFQAFRDGALKERSPLMQARCTWLPA